MRRGGRGGAGEGGSRHDRDRKRERKRSAGWGGRASVKLQLLAFSSGLGGESLICQSHHSPIKHGQNTHLVALLLPPRAAPLSTHTHTHTCKALYWFPFTFFFSYGLGSRHQTRTAARPTPTSVHLKPSAPLKKFNGEAASGRQRRPHSPRMSSLCWVKPRGGPHSTRTRTLGAAV